MDELHRIKVVSKRLKLKYIQWFGFILEKCDYNITVSDGTNNFKHNVLDFLVMLCYCALSIYNVVRTFDPAKDPSYSMFSINCLMLLRYFIGNRITIADRLNQYKKETGISDDKKVKVTASSVRNLLEGLTIIFSLVFILLARFYQVDIFNISSVLVVAVAGIFSIVFTAMEETIQIAVNMFLAEPSVYIKEGIE